MTTKQKLLWTLPYAGLLVAVFVAGQHAIYANATVEGQPAAAAAIASDAAKVKWDAIQPEPDPSPRSVAAYGFEGR